LIPGFKLVQNNREEEEDSESYEVEQNNKNDKHLKIPNKTIKIDTI
jgi:hypothetical protein